MHTHPCLASDLLQLLGGAFDSAAGEHAAGECASSASESLPDELPESESGHFKQINKLANLLLFHLTNQTTSLIKTAISKCCTTAVKIRHYHPKTN